MSDGDSAAAHPAPSRNQTGFHTETFARNVERKKRQSKVSSACFPRLIRTARMESPASFSSSRPRLLVVCLRFVENEANTGQTRRARFLGGEKQNGGKGLDRGAGTHFRTNCIGNKLKLQRKKKSYATWGQSISSWLNRQTGAKNLTRKKK